MTDKQLHLLAVLEQIEKDMEEIKKEIAVLVMFEEVKENL